MLSKSSLVLSLAALLSSQICASEEIGSVDIKRIQTPDVVETSIGTLKFIDGAPLPETAQKAYDYLDTMRGVDAFLKGIPAASIQGMMEGPRVIGQKTSNQIVMTFMNFLFAFFGFK
ncbi:hypothetical protein PQO03_07725 [Lentisphaera profundi]|uniref:Uncharacterized protein n=1 Tax=Lentisphaera profundi TaxID=1658616 RepID=A0ABY7VU06_9BACT|nr:hypothetical protein [Lentisphaera profundi]WDE95608.1 hypothetical protein PQO03_07725 [Lentisphaera profundi]